MQQQQLVVPPNPHPTATVTIASVESINQSITILVGAWTWQMLAEVCQSSQKNAVCIIMVLLHLQIGPSPI